MIQSTLHKQTRGFNQVTLLEDPQFDILMVDIEGGEVEFVELMDRPYFKAIIAKIHDGILGDEKTDRLMQKLEMLGYTLLKRALNSFTRFAYLKNTRLHLI